MGARADLRFGFQCDGDWPHDAGSVELTLLRVDPVFAHAAHLQDDAGKVTPARARSNRAALEAREARGLVSVPTSGNATLLGQEKSFVQRSDLVEELQAFEVDKQARRLAMLRMNVGFGARAHAVSEKGHRTDVAWMVTLTYRGDNSDWAARHLSDALHGFRLWCGRRRITVRYVWVAELQKRGVIHYHLAIWLPRGIRMPKWDVRLRSSKSPWWPHGMANRILAKHATAYLMKYLSKGSDYGQLPRGARAYGVGGLDHSLRRARRWLGLPSFVQGNSSILDQWRRAVGGGWIDPCGEWFRSEFETAFIAGKRMLSRVVTHARTIQAAGPFSWITDRATALALA